MPFNCDECDKEVMWLHYLSEYGQKNKKVVDSGEYCQDCFNIKFKDKVDDKSDKK